MLCTAYPYRGPREHFCCAPLWSNQVPLAKCAWPAPGLNDSNLHLLSPTGPYPVEGGQMCYAHQVICSAALPISSHQLSLSSPLSATVHTTCHPVLCAASCSGCHSPTGRPECQSNWWQGMQVQVMSPTPLNQGPFYWPASIFFIDY